MTVGLVIAGTVAVRAGAGSTATDGGQALVRIDTRARAVSLASTTLAPADHFVLLTHSRAVPLLPGSAPESVLPGESYAAIVLARDGVGAECVPIVRDDRFLQSGDVVLPSPPPSQVTLQFVGLGGKPLPGVSLAARLEGAPDVDVTALLCPVSVADKNGDLACAVPPGTLLTAVAGTQSRVIDLAARAT